MFNALSIGEATEHFRNLLEQDSRTKGYENDLGLISIANEMEYRLIEHYNKYLSDMGEFYEPQSEYILLSRLMCEIGYLKFKKPLIISIDIITKEDVSLVKGQRFTDGVNMFFLDSELILRAGVKTSLNLTRGSVKKIPIRVDKDLLYFKIKLGASYKEITKVKLYRDKEELSYSQAFSSQESDYSLEVNVNSVDPNINGELQIVVRCRNTNGMNIKVGDNLIVEVYTSDDSNLLPATLYSMSDFSMICENIIKISNYEPPLSRDDMKNILKYNKNINNTLIYNEDYKNFLKAWIPNIDQVKVWHQEEEEKEKGASTCAINKVFISCIGKEGSLDQEIKEIINKTVYGRMVVMVEPRILDVPISIKITENRGRSVELFKEEEIKALLGGYYDNIDKVLTKHSLYTMVSDILRIYNVDIEIEIGELGVFSNRTFYNVDYDKIIIEIVSRG